MSEKYGSPAEPRRHLVEAYLKLIKKRLQIKCKNVTTPKQQISWLEQVILPMTKNVRSCCFACMAAWCYAMSSLQKRSDEFSNSETRQITYFFYIYF